MPTVLERMAARAKRMTDKYCNHALEKPPQSYQKQKVMAGTQGSSFNVHPLGQF